MFLESCLRQACRLFLTLPKVFFTQEQDTTGGLNVGSPEVLHTQSPHKTSDSSTWDWPILDSSHGYDHLLPQAVMSGNEWYRQLMTGKAEEVIRGSIQLITLAAVQERSWKAHNWHKGWGHFQALPCHKNCTSEVHWSGILGLRGQVFSRLEESCE